MVDQVKYFHKISLDDYTRKYDEVIKSMNDENIHYFST